ncbi:IPTL-CTERM sorting domain-containing protein [Ottowia thiooxydans]|uniref:IPTL-CTERM protein sorting domain-containing protein n=1 Tax=Ottowia thiooxydans TaxID=219182 RepID=A0ABV2QG86_9BURK
MNASFDRSLPSSLRIRRPLVSSLVLVGLLSAHGAWAATWNINFTPKQTTSTPLEPVFSWTPPDANTMFGTVIDCTGGAISALPGPGMAVYGLDGPPVHRAFVQFANVYAAPSSVAVTVTPDTPGGAVNCTLDTVPTSYSPGSGSAPQYNIHANIRDGWVHGIFANEDPAGWQLSFSPTNTGSTSNTLFLDPTVGGPAIGSQISSGPITDSGPATTNLFMNGKTTAATVEYELTQPQPTDTTITFTVEAEPQAYGTQYDPTAGGYQQPEYTTPKTVTVTIPAGSTTAQVSIPNILPGSQVTITPVSQNGFNIVNSPILVKTTPLPVATTIEPTTLVNLVTPGDAGVFTQTSPTNVIDFKVVLDKPIVQPPEPKPPTAVPTINEWGLGLLGALLAGFAALRRRSLTRRG